MDHLLPTGASFAGTDCEHEMPAGLLPRKPDPSGRPSADGRRACRLRGATGGVLKAKATPEARAGRYAAAPPRLKQLNLVNPS